jgi:hypothetical protein
VLCLGRDDTSESFMHGLSVLLGCISASQAMAGGATSDVVLMSLDDHDVDRVPRKLHTLLPKLSCSL